MSTSMLFAQENINPNHHPRIRIGLNYGQASQAHFPFDSPDYLYENIYFKMQFNYLLKQYKRIGFELHVEPSVYHTTYQLLNKYYLQPESGTDYLELREIYTEERTFYEYAFNIGIIFRYKIINPLSTYLIGSIGPMICEKSTERLRQGFAFSDIFGIGLSYKIRKIIIDSRLTLRHNSNANLSLPNTGHNSVGFEGGVSFQL